MKKITTGTMQTFFICEERLYLTANGKKLVKEGDAKAATLYATPGTRIPEEAALKFGLVTKESIAKEEAKEKAEAAAKEKARADAKAEKEAAAAAEVQAEEDAKAEALAKAEKEAAKSQDKSAEKSENKGTKKS